jgi:transposase
VIPHFTEGDTVFRKKTRDEAPTFWIATSDLPSTPADSFYQKLDAALRDCAFGDTVRQLAAPFYEMDARKGGQPGIDPEVYFKMLMVGFFENLRSERAIAARCADSLSIRAFLHYGLGERTPHHSSFTVIRQRLASEVYDAVFGLILGALRAKKLVKGKHLAIDTSVLEANASLRSLEHRLTGERYRQYVKRLAAAAGVDTADPRAVSTFDRKRQGRKTSNAEWQNPHDPDAKVGPDKKGVTRMQYKPEHVVDLDTGAIVDVELQFGDHHDAHGLANRVLEVEGRMNVAVGEAVDVARVKAVVADMGYCDAMQLGQLQTVGIRTAIADPVRHRRWEKLAVEERRALRTAQRTTRSASGRALMCRRGELCERSFVHVLDYGGARRTTLRGWENIRKRYLIQAACANLALLLRHGTGVGTLKQSWAASEGALCALIVAIHILLHQQIEHGDSNRHAQHRSAGGASCPSPERCCPLDVGNSTVC